MFKARFPTILLVLCLIPIPFTPTGQAAFTWTGTFSETVDPSITSVLRPGTNAAVSYPGGFVTAQTHSDANSLIFWKCTVATGLCDDIVVAVSDGSGAEGYDAALSLEGSYATSTTINGCFGVSGTVYPGMVYLRSTNGGQGWGFSSLPTATARFGCGVAKSGSNVWAAGVNFTTDNDIFMHKSTDSGSTWGTGFYLDNSGSSREAEDGDGFDADIQIAAADANNAILTYVRTDGAIGRCYTTTGGATTESWTCGGSIGVSGRSNSMQYDVASASWYGLAVGATTVTYYSFDSPSGLTTFSGISGTEVNAATSSIVKVNATTILASWIHGPSACSSRFSMSTDNGASWSTAETVQTVGSTCTTSTSSLRFSAGVGHLGNKAMVGFGSGANNVLTMQAATATLVEAAPPIGASASATVTGLVGFDVDRLGTNLIARTDSGSHVRTFTPNTMGLAASFDTDCISATPRVFAQHVGSNALVGYVACNDIGVPTHLHVRTGSLNIPGSQQLNGASPGAATISLTGFSTGGSTELGLLDEIATFPIDYTEQQSGLGSIGTVTAYYLAWGWTSSALSGPNLGLAGVNSFSNHEGLAGPTDERRSAEVSYGGTDALGYCTGLDGSTPYMAVGGNSGTKTYVLTPFFTTESGNHQALNFTVTLQASIGAPSSHVACGSGLVAARESNNVKVFTRNGGILANIPFTGVQNCLGLSDFIQGHGQYLTYCNTSTWEARQLYDGNGTFTNTVVGSGTSPGGTIKDGALTRAAQQYFIGNSTSIVRFDLVAGGAVDEQAETGGEVVVTPPPGSGTAGGLFGGAGQAAGVALGTSTFGGSIFLGIIVTIGCALAMFAATRGRVFGLIAGVALGVVLSWGLSFFSGGTVFAIVLICGGLAFVTRGA